MNFSEAESCQFVLQAVLEALACNEGVILEKLHEIAEDAKARYIAGLPGGGSLPRQDVLVRDLPFRRGPLGVLRLKPKVC